jgi:hypothetical protein
MRERGVGAPSAAQDRAIVGLPAGWGGSSDACENWPPQLHIHTNASYRVAAGAPGEGAQAQQQRQTTQKWLIIRFNPQYVVPVSVKHKHIGEMVASL